MKSDLPKVLHPVGGKAMVVRSLETAAAIDSSQQSRLPVIVVGHGADQVRAQLSRQAQFALQAQQLGTGHAVMQAADLLRGQADIVVVYYADMPLLKPETL